MNDFINQFNGASVDFDHTAGSQCVDLAKLWLDYLGYDASGTWGNGKDWNKNDGRQGLKWIANTPTGLPQVGDLIVWGSGIGAYGHIAIFVEGDLKRFKSFDQNYPVGSVCKLVEHNYNSVIGWLRTKYSPAVTLEKDAVQFQGSDRVYFWAQNPTVASQWYGANWGQYVRIITPQIVKEEVIKEVIKEVENPVNIQLQKELQDQKMLYKIDMEIKDEEIDELREKIRSLGLSPEELKVLSFWEKLKSLIGRLK